MARPAKPGIDYFPFDTDFFSDLRIRKLIRYQGGEAVTVYLMLLSNIYRNGYYIRWDESLPFILSEQSGYEEDYILKVIGYCLDIGLLHKPLYDSAQVLTSRAIQERYHTICTQCHRTNTISDYSLIKSEETPIKSEETPVKSEETPIKSEEMPQRKENKNKKRKTSSVDDVGKKKHPTPTPLISWNGSDRRRCRGQAPIQPRNVTNVSNALIAVGTCHNAVYLRNAHIVVGTCHGMSANATSSFVWLKATCHGMSLLHINAIQAFTLA